jgi:hypothetical protein
MMLMVPVGAMVVTVECAAAGHVDRCCAPSWGTGRVPGQLLGLLVAGALDEAPQAIGQLDGLVAVVRDSQLKEQVCPSHDAQADAPIGFDHGVDLGQWIRVRFDHIVEEAYREFGHALHLTPVDFLTPSRSTRKRATLSEPRLHASLGKAAVPRTDGSQVHLR